MKEINEILPLISAPSYSLLIIIAALSIFFLVIFVIFKHLKKPKTIKITKYKKSDFIKDLNLLTKNSQYKFDLAYWKKLSKLFKKYITENIDNKTHFLSLEQILKRNHLSHLHEIFETFNKQFYYYKKQEKQEFIKLINKIKKEI